MTTGEPDTPLVLVVDDDEAVRSLIADALTPRGFRVVGAGNGVEGLDAIRREVPRLIVLDYWMPVVDGAGFMRALPDLLSRLPPVILFTAAGEDARLARNLGVDVFVEKPVDLQRFVKLVEATLRGARVAVAQTPRAEGCERRAYARKPIRRPIEVRLPGGHAFAPAFIVDASEGGLCLDLGVELKAGSYLAIACDLGDGHRVELDARVRHAGPHHVGVQFFALDEARRRWIAELLASAP